MKRVRSRSFQSMVFAVTLGVAGLVLPQFSSPQAAEAQTTVPAGTPVAICGPVAGYTAASSTAAGSITFSNVNTTQSFALPTATTFPGLPSIATGTNLCLVGTVNSAGQVTSATLISNLSTTVNLCGLVTAYTPASLSSLGSLTIGGQVVTLGLGTTLSGATLTTGSNLCIAANVNSLGIVNNGTATANTGGTTGGTLVSICGPVSSYTAATSSAAGSITISNVSVNATYTFPAGTSTTGNLAITSGSNVCLLGVSNGSGQLSTATFIANTTTQVITCGTVSRYTAATTSGLVVLTVGSASIPLAVGTTFTGVTLTTGTNLCFTLTLNSLGQVVNGTVSAPLTATLYVPTSVPALAYRNLARPL